jgi:hypothetical protein
MSIYTSAAFAEGLLTPEERSHQLTKNQQRLYDALMREVPPEKFNMDIGLICGTAACIAGTAALLSCGITRLLTNEDWNVKEYGIDPQVAGSKEANWDQLHLSAIEYIGQPFEHADGKAQYSQLFTPARLFDEYATPQLAAVALILWLNGIQEPWNEIQRRILDRI